MPAEKKGVVGPTDRDEITDEELARRVREADVVVLLSDGGRTATNFVKGVGPVPIDWEVSFGEKDDPPGTIRMFTMKGGWTKAEWLKCDRSALHEEAG
jgi:hypothetical protein